MIDERLPDKTFSTKIDSGLLVRMGEYCRKNGRKIRWFIEGAIRAALDRANGKQEAR
jgi:hypothetical protein